MTANEISNNSSPASALAWELPPLYKRINWAALLVPPIGVILLLLAAMYLFPYIKKRFGAKRAKKIYRDPLAPRHDSANVV
ncbi:uncharacterized protein LOC135461298 isoform X3 [Liolophura sinensis]|uniref:uncharacterized protein LOC135461298 isoform X3 n=1 Tax=Liolophura sinensis TaxID=3198878 RepID=UPI0031585730